MSTDLHSHLVPGVDDGASSIEEAMAALEAMRDEGVTAAVTTPHLDGSLTRDAARLAARLEEMDRGWEILVKAAAERFPDFRLARGTEVMLDIPAPDLSEPRVRLAGTRFVLVEFPHMLVPPNSAGALFEIRMQGYVPVVAHPERYGGAGDSLAIFDEWVRTGALLQMNALALLGRYGEKASRTAWRLLERGHVSVIASDYHARGRIPLREARAKLEERGGEELAELLMETNPAKVLGDEVPDPAPPLQRRRKGFWGRVFGRRGG